MTNGALKHCGIGGAFIAIFVFHFFFAPTMFPPVPGGEVNYGWDRVIGFAMVGVLGCAVGALFGSLIQRLLADDRK